MKTTGLGLVEVREEQRGVEDRVGLFNRSGVRRGESCGFKSEVM